MSSGVRDSSVDLINGTTSLGLRRRRQQQGRERGRQDQRTGGRRRCLWQPRAASRRSEYDLDTPRSGGAGDSSSGGSTAVKTKQLERRREREVGGYKIIAPRGQLFSICALQGRAFL